MADRISPDGNEHRGPRSRLGRPQSVTPTGIGVDGSGSRRGRETKEEQRQRGECIIEQGGILLLTEKRDGALGETPARDPGSCECASKRTCGRQSLRRRPERKGRSLSQETNVCLDDQPACDTV